jgi:hypothetical protein
MLAVTAGRVLAGHMGANQGVVFLPPSISDPLKAGWQRHVLASSGYLELGMFNEAAQVLEEIAPEDKNRNEVLGARVNLYIVAKKWDMAAAVASHLVKVDPGTAGGGSASPMRLGAPKASRRRRPFCCGRKRSIPKLPRSLSTLLVMRALLAAWKRRKSISAMQSLLIKTFAD